MPNGMYGGVRGRIISALLDYVENMMDKEKTALFIGKPKSVTFDLIGVKFPSTKDVYFRAKQEEIIEYFLNQFILTL